MKNQQIGKKNGKMKNMRIRKALLGAVMTGMLAFTVPWGVLTSLAASVRIAFSDPTVTAGEEVNVTLKISSLDGGALGHSSLMLSYDPNILEFVSGADASGGAGSVSVRQTAEAGSTEMATSLTFKALQAGSTQITVSTQEVYDADEEMATVDRLGNSTVTVEAEDGASADAGLKSLKVSPGTLSPEFSSDVTEYSVSVGPDVTKLAVSAEANDESATVTVNGSSDLQMGENTVNCVVTAADGQSQTYIIHVTKTEGGAEAGGAVAAGDLTVVIDQVQYSVAQSFDVSTLPEGFEGFTYNYKGQDIMAGRGIQKDLLLLCLVNGDGEAKFFIYNEASDSFSAYMEVSTTPKSVIVLEPDESVTVPAGFTEGIMNLPGGGQVSGWVPAGEENPKYMIFYGMNWNGVKDFYRYDLEENTIQRYFQDIPGVSGISSDQYQDVVGTYTDLLHDYDMRGIVIIFLIAVAAGLAIALIVVVKKGGKQKDDGGRPEKKSRKKKDEDQLAAAQQAASREEKHRERHPEPEKPEEPETEEVPDLSEEDDLEVTDLDDEDEMEVLDLDGEEDEPDSEAKEKNTEDDDDDIELIDL